jgi:hypothetical protein
MKLFLAVIVITFGALLLDGLLTYGTPAISQVIIYVLIAAAGLILLMARRLFSHEKEWLGWEDNPGSKNASALWWFGGVAAVFSCAHLIPAFLTGIGFRAALFIPQPNVLAATFSISEATLLDIFFNATVVGIAEQMLILSFINALVSEASSDLRKYGTAVLIVAFISGAHGYLAYVGPLMWVGIIAAFAAFMVMFVIQLKTKSLVLVGFVHVGYNEIEILLPILLGLIGIHA